MRKWRRGWDSNPRKLALHALSKRADSAALAPLRIIIACECTTRTTAGYLNERLSLNAKFSDIDYET
ncbi:MAG: hypothetical protein RL072_1237 [Actinomycetota bacterium]